MRIGDRFPNAGLRKVCGQFAEIARRSKANIHWISKPNLVIRLASYAVIALGVGGLLFSIRYVDWGVEDTTMANIVTLTEAIFNDIVLLGAAIFFLVTMESRVKRKRALSALHELRVVCHVIDMHQLTKDPHIAAIKRGATVNSPTRSMDKFELERYLDYCSEASALIAKVAALYSQSLPDEVVTSSVNEIENLTTGLSRKIWQKIMILDQVDEGTSMESSAEKQVQYRSPNEDAD